MAQHEMYNLSNLMIVNIKAHFRERLVTKALIHHGPCTLKDCRQSTG